MPVQDTARRRACSIAAAALAASLVALPAAAQWFGEPGYAPIPPRAVVGMLYGQGFRQVGRPRWVGDRYLVEGVDRYGIPVRLAVDPTGDVLGRRNLAAADPVPPRNVGPGPVRVVPREFGRVDSFGEEMARVFAPTSPRREAERRGERLQRQAARPEARPAAPHVKPASPVEARAPDPSAAKPAATAPVEPAPRPAQPGPVATRAAPEPARPEPAASPAAPIPSVEALRPEAPRESPTAAAAPNVRVIEGVTPVVPRQPAEVSEPEPPAPVD